MTPRRIRIDLASRSPVYEQIADSLRALLVQEAFNPGERLPTVRRLAADLGLHHNTVAEAYRTLAAEGWLDLKRGRGASVSDRATPRSSPKVKKDFVKRLERLAVEAIACGVPRSVVARQVKLLAGRLKA
ncbi:MAG: GntR family transcriptional regulator [Terriglobia bacterium]